MRNILYISMIIGIVGLLAQSCTTDKLVPAPNNCDDTPPVWDNEVDDIIQLTCAYSGCHISGTSAPGNYLTYSGILSDLNNGSFKSRVFDIKDNPILGMPPDNSSGPKDLTTEQLNILSCWMEAGFPEN